MNGWAIQKPEEREALFNQTASKMAGISPEIVEKDFWVCWTLHQLFQLRDTPFLIFKGGTSLSKVFGIIKRFSEDIDLVLNRHELGFDAGNDPANQTGTKRRKRTIDNLKEKCVAYLADEFIPKLRRQMESVLGNTGWSLAPDNSAPDHDTFEFAYPPGLATTLVPGYIRRSVRLEIGCRGDQVPSEVANVYSYSAETFPDQFEMPFATVSALAAERTFWEKATLIHRECYRAENGKEISDRVFRHYHDLVMISKHERGKSAMRDLALLAQVAEHKEIFFREPAAHYGLACKGTLRLVPGTQLEKSLRRDYEKMSKEMYFGDAPDFDAVMSDIRELEKMINQG
jgi:hypothetical protein